MPSRIKVKVIAARDLPVMDQASNLTDAYVEVRIQSTNTKAVVQGVINSS